MKQQLIKPIRGYIRKRAFQSIYEFDPVPPPHKWFLNTIQYASAIGVRPSRIEAWRKLWRSGKPEGAQPVRVGNMVKYRFDDVTGMDLVKIWRDERRALYESTSTRDNDYHRHKQSGAKSAQYRAKQRARTASAA